MCSPWGQHEIDQWGPREGVSLLLGGSMMSLCSTWGWCVHCGFSIDGNSVYIVG